MGLRSLLRSNASRRPFSVRRLVARCRDFKWARPQRRHRQPQEAQPRASGPVQQQIIHQWTFETTVVLEPNATREFLRREVHGAPGQRRGEAAPNRSEHSHTRHPLNRPVARASMARMTPVYVHEVLAYVGRALPHIPYAVSGLAAMVHHGYTGRSARHVTITCPSEKRSVLQGWIVAMGMSRLPVEDSSFGVYLSDGTMRAVRVRYMPRGFEELETVRDRGTCAKVLSLGSIANDIARRYVDELGTAPAWKQEVFGRDMKWVLRKMVDGGKRLSWLHAWYVGRSEFWVPFTLSFPDTVPLFASVGLEAEVAAAAAAGGSPFAAGPMSWVRDHGSDRSLMVEVGESLSGDDDDSNSDGSQVSSISSEPVAGTTGDGPSALVRHRGV